MEGRADTLASGTTHVGGCCVGGRRPPRGKGLRQGAQCPLHGETLEANPVSISQGFPPCKADSRLWFLALLFASRREERGGVGDGEGRTSVPLQEASLLAGAQV